MVRKKEIPVSPVCVSALSAALAIYPFFFLAPDRKLMQAAVVCSAAALCAVSALLPFPGKLSRKGRIPVVCVSVLAGILLGSACSLRILHERAPLKTLADPCGIAAISGTLTSDPVPWGSGLYRAPLRTTSCGYAGSAHFSASGNCTVLIPAALYRELLPGGIARKDHSSLFSAGLSMELKGKLAPYDGEKGETFIAASVVDMGVNGSSPAARFRAGLRLSLMRILYDWKDAGGFLLALLSANRDYLSPRLAADFKTAGLSHILALSGMHLSLLAMVTIKAGKRIGGKRFSIRLSVVAIIFFVWFAGAAPSLNRALVMALLLAGTRALGFSGGMLPALAATALVQTLANPSESLSLAFMLSYGALWGILGFGEALVSLGRGRIPGTLLSPLSASVGAQLMTTPVLAFATGVLAPAGIVSSCIASPLSSLFLVAGMVLVFLSVLIPPIAPACGAILDLLYRSVEWPVRLFAAVPPLKLEDLPQTIAAGIISLAAGFLLLYASAISVKRRSPDACFARL